MRMNKSLYRVVVLLAGVIVAGSAMASATIHLSEEGLCNKLSSPIHVKYSAKEGVSVEEETGIHRNHGKGSDIAAGACAQIKFKVEGIGEVDFTIEAHNAKGEKESSQCVVVMDGGDDLTMSCNDMKSFKVHGSHQDKHFQITVKDKE